MPQQNLYFVGIAGTAMASVAHALHRDGYLVRGSDNGVYPPMCDFLSGNGIEYYTSFDAAHLIPTPDLVVVGNAISRGNPELEEVLNIKIPYTSLPALVRLHLIRDHDSIVITGTHGKTTTTSLVAWLFEVAGLKPGFLIGGVPENFQEGCRPAGGNIFITEGDEYDTAFFDKRSKFLHYAPDAAVINNIEYDHADIFSSIDEIKKSFRHFVNLIPSHGFLIVNGDDENVRDVISHAHCSVETFGFHDRNTWRAEIESMGTEGALYRVFQEGKLRGAFTIPLTGKFNVLNSLAGIMIAHRYSISTSTIQKAFSSFKGIKRRMEIVDEVNGIMVIDDFAHHPTAIRETINAVRTRFHGRRIWALFEPRSNTTVRNVFQNELEKCFSEADVTIIGAINRPGRFRLEERLLPEKIIASLRARNKEAFYIPDVDEMIHHIATEAKRNDLILFLSNGEFGGARKKLLDRLRPCE